MDPNWDADRSLGLQKLRAMSIQALPESTTRRLGAGQALPSPVALVKELLDNAIDARATSIEVLLTTNTLDKIVVRDNGTGIRADDLDQVGKRGHTSKKPLPIGTTVCVSNLFPGIL